MVKKPFSVSGAGCIYRRRTTIRSSYRRSLPSFHRAVERHAHLARMVLMPHWSTPSPFLHRRLAHMLPELLLLVLLLFTAVSAFGPAPGSPLARSATGLVAPCLGRGLTAVWSSCGLRAGQRCQARMLSAASEAEMAPREPVPEDERPSLPSEESKSYSRVCPVLQPTGRPRAVSSSQAEAPSTCFPPTPGKEELGGGWLPTQSALKQEERQDNKAVNSGSTTHEREVGQRTWGRPRRAGSSGGGRLGGALGEALRQGHGGAALRALQLMVERGEPLREETYRDVIDSCMKQGTWQAGLKAFELLSRDVGQRGRSPNQKTWMSLAKGMRAAGQVDQAVALLDGALAAGQTTGARGIDEQVCSIVLDLCVNKEQMGQAERVIQLMDEHSIPKGPITYCILVKGYGRQGRASMVDNVLLAMQEDGVRPDVVAANAAVDAYVRCGELTKAKAVLHAMEASTSLAPNTRTYNTLIKGLGQEGLMDEAFAVADAMASRGCLPDQVTTNSLVDMCVRCGALDRAYGLLKQQNRNTRKRKTGSEGARDGGEDGDGGEGGRPSVKAFTAVLTGFADVGDKDRALGVFKQMVTAGVEPNVVTFTALVSACVNAGDMDEAKLLFRAMEARGDAQPALLPTVFTYNSLITGLCRNTHASQNPSGNSASQGDAVTRDDSDSSGTPQEPEGMEGLLNSSTVVGLPGGVQKALQLLLTMRRRGVSPDEVTMNALVDGLVSCAPPRMAQAEALVALMRTWGLNPNRFTYSAMIKGWGRAKDLKRAEGVYAAMARDPDCWTDVVALNSLLEACVRSADVQRAAALLEQTCELVLSARRDGPEAAEGKEQRGQRRGAAAFMVSPDVVSFTTVIFGFAHSGSVNAGKKAMALYMYMREVFGMEPDQVLVKGLMRACCTSGPRGNLSLEQGLLVLKDLETLGWDEQFIRDNEDMLRSTVPALSEVWKEDEDRRGRAVGDGDKKKKKQKKPRSAEIFEKYGWNEMDSHFPFM